MHLSSIVTSSLSLVSCSSWHFLVTAPLKFVVSISPFPRSSHMPICVRAKPPSYIQTYMYYYSFIHPNIHVLL
eukprot:c30885_g1_i1 orf=38-256(+)